MKAKIIKKILEFETPHFVSVNARYFKRGVALSTVWRRETKLFRQQLSSFYKGPLFTSESFILETYIPSRFDFDNLQKFVCDNMQGIVYAKDRQIIAGYSERQPGRSELLRINLYTARYL